MQESERPGGARQKERTDAGSSACMCGEGTFSDVLSTETGLQHGPMYAHKSQVRPF